MRKVYALSFVVAAATMALSVAPARAANRDDTRLGKRVEEQLRQDERLRDYVLQAEVDDGVATLTGKVALDAAKEHAEKVALVPGVRRVENQIEVAAMTLDGRLALQAELAKRRAPVPAEASAGGSAEQLRPAQAAQEPQGEQPASAGQPAEQAAAPAEQAAAPVEQPAAPAQPAAENPAAQEPVDPASAGEVDENGFVQIRVLPTPAGDPQKMVSGESVTQSWINTRIMTELEGDEALKGSNVKIETTSDFAVTLKGTVASEFGRQRAVQVAKNTKGVVEVDDQLKVATRR